jgi:hypothetical protein
VLFSGSGQAQCISLTTSGSAYTQNFNSLASSGTSSTLPAGWFMLETGTNANTTYSAGTGSSNTGDTYSFGSTTAPTDRALGGLRSGSLVPLFGACFTNNTGAAITSLAVSYFGEEWRLGTAGRTDQLNFEYSVNATALNTGTWSGVSALNFITPDTTTVGAKDGNSAGERTSLSSTISSLSVANGATFWIRWSDVDATGADDGLAVDDFSLTPTAAAASPAGVGAASPSSGQPGDPVLLTVTVTPGSNPISTVIVDLSAIGGSSTQQFFDDGTHGDVTAGNNVFSFSATVGALATTGLKSLPFTITDTSSATGTGSIAFTVTSAPPTNPTGTGSANPSTVVPGAGTLLTVTVTPGMNPTSTGISVTADLTAIGGTATQQFFDDGTHGDVTVGDNIFSFSATVNGATAPGSLSLPVTIKDAQLRTATPAPSISLTVQAAVPAPTSVKISQVYGGGGNSGSTYKNDFIELFNQSTSAVDITGWSVQQLSAAGTGTWNLTPLCPSGPCSIQPGHYFLVQESAGTSGTTNLPTADVIGTLALGASSGKVALVDNSVALSGACPSSAAIADMMGYDSSATCFETAPAGTLDNLSAALRKGNGCTDTNNNSTDFTVVGPLPRNSAAPPQTCGGNPAQPSGLGTASPSSVDPGGNTLLKVAVVPASTPASTGITVTADLTSIGGSANQPLYDDGTHGDSIAGDNNFFFQTEVALLPTGAKYIVATVSDQQGRSVQVPITITIQSPTCGVERWSVKVGTDADAGLVNLGSPVRTSIQSLRGLTAPADPPGPPLNNRVQPTETTVFLVNGLLTQYKKEDDVDYHIVIQDPSGNTMITEIPSPACDGTTSPFDAAIAAVRAKFDARLTAIPTFQTANIPVQMKGVAFFDFIHGQTGVAPNGIELHPILDMTFTAQSSTTLQSSLNPASFGQNVNLTANVTIPSGTPTGKVTFFDGTTPLGTATLDGNGSATIPANGLNAGTHALSVSYEGDSAASESAGTLSEVVNPAAPVLSWTKPADVLFGSALSSVQLNATANVPGTFTYNPPAGTVLPVGNNQALNATFTPTSPNYAGGPVSTTINVLPIQQPSGPTISVSKILSRDGSNNMVVQLTFTNIGGSTASNVALTSLKVGSISAPGLPAAVGTLAPSGSAVVTVNMGSPVGASGTASSMTLAGTYAGGGTFSASARITLP